MKTAKTDLLPVLTQEADQLQKQVAEFKVIDEDTLSTASDLIRRAKDIAKRIKADKEQFTAPAKAIIDAAKGKYDPTLKMLEGFESTLKSVSQTYMLARDAQRRIDEQAIADKLAKGAIKPETAMKRMDALPQEKGARTASSGLRMSTVKDVEFSDIQTLSTEDIMSLVRQGFLMWSTSEARRHVLAGLVIPGAKIIDRTITSSV